MENAARNTFINSFWLDYLQEEYLRFRDNESCMKKRNTQRTINGAKE